MTDGSTLRSPEGEDYDEGEPLTASGKPYKRPTIVACIGCRGIKVKCRLPNGGAPTGYWDTDQSKCTRCIRLHLDCVYKTAPRRGRRPKDQLPSASGQAEEESREMPRAMTLDQPDAFSGNAVASTSGASTSPFDRRASYNGVAASISSHPSGGIVPVVSLPASGGHVDVYTPNFFNPLLPSVSKPMAAPSIPQPPTWPAPSRTVAPVPPAPTISVAPSAAAASGPAPPTAPSQGSPALSSGMHASPASQASASLDVNSGLSLAEAAQARSSAFRASQPEESHRAHPNRSGRLPDPVDLWILSEAEAQALFDQWHARLNCYVILLDRHLHTFNYVREISPVLFTAVLATAAKFFRHDLYPRLLAHAQNMVTRAMGGDIEPSIGNLQAVLLLVYWKEPMDTSAWIRVGYAIRLGYQLRLYQKRTEPLPTNEIEARILLDRERTWIVLICFDNSYVLHDDDSGVETRMITGYDVDIDAWLTETLPYNVRDDAEQGVSMGLIQVSRLCRAVATASSKSAAKSVAQQVHEIILTTHQKYFEGTTTLPGLTPLRGPASHKARFHVVAARFTLAQACLSASGLHDQLILADAIIRAGEMVECFDEAAGDILLYVQDTIALMMLGFGEWIGRLFPHVSNAHQTTLVRYLTQVYLTASRAQRAHHAEVGGYIARFFRGALRAIHPESVPLTRPPSPGAAGFDVNEPSRSITAAGPSGPFEQLNGMEQEIFTDLDSLFADLKQDTTYWDSLNPTLTNSTWAWLDEAFAAPQQVNMNSG